MIIIYVNKEIYQIVKYINHKQYVKYVKIFIIKNKVYVNKVILLVVYNIKINLIVHNVIINIKLPIDIEIIYVFLKKHYENVFNMI